MGLTDGYKNEGSFGKGLHELTILSVEGVSSPRTGTEGLKLTYCLGQSTDHPVNKTLWKSKMFNRFLTSWITGLGLNPSDLEDACKSGRGDNWITMKIPGRHGVFEFVETEKKSERTGKPFLEPKSAAEIEFDAWVKEQSNTRQSNDEPPDYTDDDVPFSNQF